MYLKCTKILFYQWMSWFVLPDKNKIMPNYGSLGEAEVSVKNLNLFYTDYSPLTFHPFIQQCPWSFPSENNQCQVFCLFSVHLPFFSDELCQVCRDTKNNLWIQDVIMRTGLLKSNCVILPIIHCCVGLSKRFHEEVAHVQCYEKATILVRMSDLFKKRFHQRV